MKKEDLFVHIGPSKCGTSFLSEYVFSNLKGFYHNAGGEDIFTTYIDRSKPAIIRQDLTVIAFLPGFKKENRFVIIRNLYTLFPDAKIILGLREKNSWIKSLYGQYIKNGGRLKYNEWYNNILNKDALDFDSYINYIKKHFSDVYIYHFEDIKKDINKFVKDMCDFMNVDVPPFENINPNPKWSNKQIKIARFLNKFGTPYGIRFWMELLSK